MQTHISKNELQHTVKVTPIL